MKDSFMLGAYGEAYVYLCLQRIYDNIRKVPSNINQQMEYGDLVQFGCNLVGIADKKFEVKTELTDPNNNFYMELWSNKKTGREGWLKTSVADELFYIYWDSGYGFYFTNWQNTAWIIDYYSNQYPLIEQKKNQQSNETWGLLVSHKSLSGTPFEPVKFDLSDNVKAEAIQLAEDWAATDG